MAGVGVICNGNMSYYVNIMQQNMATFNPPSSKTMIMEVGQVDTLYFLLLGS